MTNLVYRPQATLSPTAAEIAEWAGGQCRDIPEPAPRYAGLATLALAAPDEISFAGHVKLRDAALESQAGLLIVPAGMELGGRPAIEVPEVWTAVAALMAKLYPTPRPATGVHSTAVVAQTAKLGKDVSVGPYCVIGEDCELGDRAILGPHCILDDACAVGEDSRLIARVTLMGSVAVGKRTTIHPGAVLGADGFKFEFIDRRFLKIPQVGRVWIGDDVEIGANVCVDRAFLNETHIGDGTKLDNLIQIGHNVHIGDNSILAGCSAVAGSCEIGNYCMIGGHTSLAEGVKIGDGCKIGGKSALISELAPGSNVQGQPAIPRKEFFRNLALQMKLPQYAKRLRKLEQAFETAQPQEQKKDL